MEFKILDLLYEGKAKRVFATDSPDIFVQQFKDSLTAFNGEMRATMDEKGSMNCAISSICFQALEDAGIKTHFIKRLNATDMLIKKLEMLKAEVVVRNIAAGSLCKRTGLPDGHVMQTPIVEFYYKDDDLGDPLFNLDHLLALNVLTVAEHDQLRELGLKINQLLIKFFADHSIRLVDFKLEFGKDKDGNLILGDEISPDTCRLWDSHDNTKLDKDRFRFQLGNISQAYQNVLERLMK